MAGRTVAMRTQPAGAGTPEANNVCGDGADNDGDTFIDDGCTLYLLKDHLRSTLKVKDSNGATVSSVKYWPYGSVRSGGVMQTDVMFTGQRDEGGDPAGLGLYNYTARFYSTTLGRFVSADPNSRDGFNRYAYVRNNPATFTDPTGYCIGSYSCSPQDVLNIIVCSNSTQGCIEAIEYSGRIATPELIWMSVHFANVAVGRSDFWANFAHIDMNPYWNQDRLWSEAGTFERGQRLGRLFGYANRTSAPYQTEKAAKFYEFYLGYCSDVDCTQLGLDLLDIAHIAASFANSDPRLAAIGMGIYGADVQLAWTRFQNGEGSIEEVWAAVLEGAFGIPGSDEAKLVDLARAVQDVWTETVCQGEPASCNNIKPPF